MVISRSSEAHILAISSSSNSPNQVSFSRQIKIEGRRMRGRPAKRTRIAQSRSRLGSAKSLEFLNRFMTRPSFLTAGPELYLVPSDGRFSACRLNHDQRRTRLAHLRCSTFTLKPLRAIKGDPDSIWQRCRRSRGRFRLFDFCPLGQWRN